MKHTDISFSTHFSRNDVTRKQKIMSIIIIGGIFITAPALFHSQWITGPIINAGLIVAAVLVGTSEALTLCLIPSIVALSTGLLPLPLAPAVPFIMMGNALYVMTFHYIREKNFIAALFAAAVIKWGFLSLTALLLLVPIMDTRSGHAMLLMMSWPQFVTALGGGAVAVAILKVLTAKTA